MGDNARVPTLSQLWRRLSSQSAQTLLEYALIVTAVAVVVIVAAAIFGGNVGGLFGSTAQHV
ncbi:MAG: Flp family type IVb pilin [Solirubrobacteraceae bacterium]